MEAEHEPIETLYLIDGHAQIFRAYYAIRGGLRSSVTGEPTHAVFGFTGMLIKLLSQFRPNYVVAAMDMPGKTFRDDLFDEYKGTRETTPDDLISQIPRIQEVTEKTVRHPYHRCAGIGSRRCHCHDYPAHPR